MQSQCISRCMGRWCRDVQGHYRRIALHQMFLHLFSCLIYSVYIYKYSLIASQASDNSGHSSKGSAPYVHRCKLSQRLRMKPECPSCTFGHWPLTTARGNFTAHYRDGRSQRRGDRNRRSWLCSWGGNSSGPGIYLQYLRCKNDVANDWDCERTRIHKNPILI